MSTWMQLLFLLCAGILIWFGVKFIRNNPGQFSKENIGKSFYTTGILTLGLIAFVALLVFLLKHN
ncbi:MAG: hypothetical protein A3E82_00095 [Gammaproteobacteria bacterium RIFCSPHIGHO2_12_FULL_38_11]|nr:MAG: hypothetical protein A3E82_00095 [Gammaproteobacteria bacterium RIFCSPHIGHO2_12_FULL_38_11]